QRTFLGAEAGKHQVEPHHVRTNLADGLENAAMIAQPVHHQGTLYVKIRQFRERLRKFVSKDAQADKRIRLKLTCNVVSVFVQYHLAGRKSSNKADLHGPSVPLGPFSKTTKFVQRDAGRWS